MIFFKNSGITPSQFISYIYYRLNIFFINKKLVKLAIFYREEFIKNYLKLIISL